MSLPGESAICFLDGDRGVLGVSGLRHSRLAYAERGASFEEVCYSACGTAGLPTRAEWGDLQKQLACSARNPARAPNSFRAMRSSAEGRRHGPLCAR
jgi:citrate synthase